MSVGDVAQYFNAEAGGKMWVVSWSGDEVECYRGMQLHPGAVAQALRLPENSFHPASRGSSGGWKLAPLVGMLVSGVAAFLLLRGCGSATHSISRGLVANALIPSLAMRQARYSDTRDFSAVFQASTHLYGFPEYLLF